jgi:hypothetical protein
MVNHLQIVISVKHELAGSWLLEIYAFLYYFDSVRIIHFRLFSLVVILRSVNVADILMQLLLVHHFTALFF